MNVKKGDIPSRDKRAILFFKKLLGLIIIVLVISGCGTGGGSAPTQGGVGTIPTPPTQQPPPPSLGQVLTTVDSGGDVGYYTSIAIGVDGFPVVSYWDSTNNDLKVAHCGNALCTP